MSPLGRTESYLPSLGMAKAWYGMNENILLIGLIIRKDPAGRGG